MTSVKKYIESNKDRFIEELFSLIRIPSISAKHEHKPDMEACAKRWTELLLAAGADKAVVMQTEGNPVVYGEKMVSPEAQTVFEKQKKQYAGNEIAGKKLGVIGLGAIGAKVANIAVRLGMEV